MQEQTISTTPPSFETAPDPTLAPKPTKNWVVPTVFSLVGILVASALFFLGIQIGNNQQQDQRPVVALPVSSPTDITVDSTIPSVPTEAIDPKADWEIYTSPEIGSYVTPFQIAYPANWSIDEKVNSEEPKSLTLLLSKSKNETIEITQGQGGGGTCVYYDDTDYLTFDGMGRFFSSYEQLEKPALWRISHPKEEGETTLVVCEKTSDEYNRYIDGTRIGWVSIDVQSESSMQEVRSILETIVFKPTSNTRTLFD